MDCSPHFKSRNCVGKWTSEDRGPQFDTSHVENESFVAGLPHGGDPQNEFLERDPLFKQEWDCFEDCLLSRWSSFPGLSFEERFEEAEIVLETVFGKTVCQRRNVMKSRVVSLLFRQLSSHLCLTKNQNDQLIHFLKSMVVFVAPEKEEVSKRLFATYGSCQTQALKDHERNNNLCQRYLDQCMFFSIAVDTALFRNEHLISCIGRFSFDNRAFEIPLFIRTCIVSSGIGLARFIFEMLKERKASFEKMVSVATDGAANMLGKFSGMASHFKRLVQQHLLENHIISPTMHSVWCFAHRMNLVTKSFLTTKPANVVLLFSDWFSNKRRQVAYKLFLTVTKRKAEVKVVPQPSDTRWLFYRDVVQAILSQTESVEAFVLEDDDFPDFWNSLRENELCGSSVPEEFSFDDRIIKATFGFALEMLELLGRVNTVFQKRLCTVSQMWDIVLSLKGKIASLIMQTRFPRSCELESLRGLSDPEVQDFEICLRQLFCSLETRFRYPSTSLDVKHGQNSIVSFRLLEGRVRPNGPACSVLSTIMFISFPHFVIREQAFQTPFEEELRQEVQQIAGEIRRNKTRINSVNRQRSKMISEEVGMVVQMPISLDDVFSVLDSHRYPLLWRELIKANTIFPTTVSCEQSFSVIKHSAHINMKPDTFITRATNKLYENSTTKWF